MFGRTESAEEFVGVEVLIERDEKHIHVTFTLENSDHKIGVQIDRLEILVNPESASRLDGVMHRLPDLVEAVLDEAIQDMKKTMEDGENR